jgi:hypothetical protein
MSENRQKRKGKESGNQKKKAIEKVIGQENSVDARKGKPMSGFQMLACCLEALFDGTFGTTERGYPRQILLSSISFHGSMIGLIEEGTKNWKDHEKQKLLHCTIENTEVFLSFRVNHKGPKKTYDQL